MHESLETVIFSWGKYKGFSVGHVRRKDPGYLQWMIGLKTLPGNWKQIAINAVNGLSIDGLVSNQRPITIDNNEKVEIGVASSSTAYILMPYSKSLIEKLKYEVDGRKWNPKNSRWEFPTTQLPKINAVFPNATWTDKAKKKLQELVERRVDLDDIRAKEDYDIEIPGMKLELYGYQKSGVAFADRTNGRCMIADAPGLGKTVQAIAYAQLRDLKAIIVCPLSVVLNWQKEIKKFTGKESTVWDAKGHDGKKSNQFHIVHYDAASKIYPKLIEMKFDLLVCDEATFLKNRKTIRAKSVLGSWKERRKFPGIKTKHVIFLTGTPVMSRPIEAFALLNFLDKDRFNNFYHFVQMYGGWRGVAPMNLQDLHHRTKDLVIRRKKEQVLKELPLKQRNDLFVDLAKDERKEYNELLRELFGKWSTDRKPSIKHMPKIQGFLIERKLPRVIEMIDEFLDNDRSILIFSCYLKPLHMLNDHYKDRSALLKGGIKKADRQAVIESLSTGKAKVGLFSLKAGGMGIDGLQHSIDTVVFLDMDWVPANHEQGEDRTHRIGQVNQVQAYYMVCGGTIDEYMLDILKEKQAIADVIVDGSMLIEHREKSFFKEFVKRISAAYRENFDLESIED